MSHELKYNDDVVPSDAVKLKRIKAECKLIGFKFKETGKTLGYFDKPKKEYQFIDNKSKEVKGTQWTISAAYDVLNEESFWMLEHGNMMNNGMGY